MALGLPLHPALGLEPDDLAQEGWIAAQAALERYDPSRQHDGDEKGRRGWQERRAKGAMRDVIRQALAHVGMSPRSKRQHPIQPRDPVELTRYSTHAREPWEALEGQDLEEALVRDLPTRLQQLVRMRLQGVSLRACGARLGLSESRACQLWTRALPTLQRRMASLG